MTGQNLGCLSLGVLLVLGLNNFVNFETFCKFKAVFSPPGGEFHKGCGLQGGGVRLVLLSLDDVYSCLLDPSMAGFILAI